MAAIYTRVYTYTGHAYWDNDAMSVPLSAFEVSGATDKTIGQIVSIQYEHTHSSGASAVWTLSGRLVINGKNYDSDPVQKTVGRNNVVTFVNSFSNLPTAEEFSKGATVQTVINSGTAANTYLTWYAGPKYPLRIIVTFYEDPPTKYAPQVTTFAVERVKSDGTSSPEGTYIATTLKLAFASGTPTGQAAVKLYTSTTEGVLGAETNLLERVSISSLISGVNLNTSIITGQFSAGTTFYFTVVVAIGSETAAASAQAFRAKAPIHVTNYGVSFGGFSSATENDPKEEFHNPVVFHKGIKDLAGIGIQAGGTDVVTVPANGYVDFSGVFDKSFAYTPIMVVGFSTGSGNAKFGSCSCSVQTISETGYTIRVYNDASEARNPSMRWIAVGTPK